MKKPICFVTDKKPISYNSKKKAKYQTELQNVFKKYQKLYPDLPIKGEELSSKIVYIHKNTLGILDVDNLSKPFIDAFSGIIYKDDFLIKYRQCASVSLRDSGNIEINYSDMEEKVAIELDQLMKKGAQDILYLEIDDFSLKQVKIGR